MPGISREGETAGLSDKFNMGHSKEVGSYTARGGFKNEYDVAFKFNNYKTDAEAEKWLRGMGYDCGKITRLKAFRIPARINWREALALGASGGNFEETMAFKKADIQIRLEIDKERRVENISLKKANVESGYNQADKRPVDKYGAFWNMPASIRETLKRFTGEIRPPAAQKLRDPRRMYLDEMDKARVDELLRFFRANKIMVAHDALKGRGALSADWLLVTKNGPGGVEWLLRDMDFACGYFAEGSVEVTGRGSLKIGRLTAQRKGGTPDPESLQFKMNPLDLFDAEGENQSRRLPFL